MLTSDTEYPTLFSRNAARNQSFHNDLKIIYVYHSYVDELGLISLHDGKIKSINFH